VLPARSPSPAEPSITPRRTSAATRPATRLHHRKTAAHSGSMNDAPEQATTAASSGTRLPSAAEPRELGEAFSLHAEQAPPLALLAALAALVATCVNQVLLPALGDKRGYLLSRQIDQVGAFATNLSAIAGLITLGFALLSFVRFSPLLPLRKRLMFAGFAGIFLPSIAMSTLFERQRTTAETVLFAMGAAQVLIGLAGTSAARASESRYARVLALGCTLMAGASLLSQVLQLASQVQLRVWMLTAQRIAQGVGEASYLLLLVLLTPVLLPAGSDVRARAARLAGYVALPLLLGGLYVAERSLGSDYALLLYHAQRVSLFIDSFPRAYSVPIALALSGALAAVLGTDRLKQQAAAGAVLLVASGYAPFAPGRLLSAVLGAVLVCRTVMAGWAPRR
jgi:hypothetical protein